MDNSLRRWTTGAVFASIVFIWALWWDGNDNGIENACNTLGAQGLSFCSGNHIAHLLWLLIAVFCGVYLGFYAARIRKALRPRPPAGPQPPLVPHPPLPADSRPPQQHHDTPAGPQATSRRQTFR